MNGTNVTPDEQMKERESDRKREREKQQETLLGQKKNR